MTSPGDRFDVVVVGGGTAGCIIAARLSEDPTRRVALVEAGPDPRPVPVLIADPSRQGQLVRDPAYVRHLAATRADGSTYDVLAGRVLGGGSAVNNLAATRPPRADFAAWAAIGGSDWSYERMLERLRAIETDRDFGGTAHHGTTGPIPIEHPIRLRDAGPAVQALLQAAAELGWPACEDVNVPEPFGVCGPAYTTSDGRRVSTAAAYLDPSRDRPNLTILAETPARRIVRAGDAVAGVEVDGPDGRRVIPTGTVVVSGGTYHSPQLLTLSGIGPLDELQRLGLEPWVVLDGVGRGLLDHAVVDLAFAGGPDPIAAELPKLRIVARSRPDRPIPDLHVFVRPLRRRADGPATMPVSVHLLEHRSAGRVTLASPDPADPPVVDLPLAEHPEDVRALVDGIGLAEALAGRPALRPLFGPLLEPGEGVDRAAYVRTTVDSYQHGVGTCRMGPAGDSRAVVAPNGRLHGPPDVWLADASILPSLPHANPNLMTMAIAEHVAAAIGRA